MRRTGGGPERVNSGICMYVYMRAYMYQLIAFDLKELHKSYIFLLLELSSLA